MLRYYVTMYSIILTSLMCIFMLPWTAHYKNKSCAIVKRNKLIERDSVWERV